MTDKLTQKISHCKALLSRAASGEAIPKALLEEEIISLREWIGFFQHERLIHLLVLMLFAVLTFACFGIFLMTQFLPIIALFVLFFVLLVPYIFHYYHLENGVQQLYDLYERLKDCRGNTNE